MVGLGFGADDDIVDVDLTELAVVLEDEVHSIVNWKVAGALHNPNGMTRNW